MNTTVGISHFFKNNTPLFAQILGDIGLTAAAISACILFLQGNLPAGVVMPPFLITVSQWAISIGALVKFVSKFFGINTPDTKIPNPPAR